MVSWNYPLVERPKGWSIQKQDGTYVDNYVWKDEGDGKGKEQAERRRQLILRFSENWK